MLKELPIEIASAPPASADPAALVRDLCMLHAPALEESLVKAAGRLSRKANVAYCTIGEKRVAGERTGAAALIAYVTRKPVEVDRADRLPREVTLRSWDGARATVPVDVVELPGAPEVFGVRSGHLLRAADGDLGVCGFSFLHEGEAFVATAGHVVANLLQRRAYANPEVQNRRDLRFVEIGPPVYVSEFPLVAPVDEDLALIRADRVKVDPLFLLDEVAPIARHADLSVAQQGGYWYQVNGAKIACVHPEPLVPGQTVPLLIDRKWFTYTGFWKLQVVQGLARPGQSGALLCSGSGRDIVAHGIVFGGIEPGFVYVFPISRVMRRIESALN